MKVFNIGDRVEVLSSFRIPKGALNSATIEDIERFEDDEDEEEPEIETEYLLAFDGTDQRRWCYADEIEHLQVGPEPYEEWFK